MPYHYSRRLGRNLKAKFEFFRFRLHFRALDTVHFPAGKSGNVIRGALGRILRDTASPAAYARLFEPGSHLGQAPSGLGDWPRPFLLRAGALDGRTVPEGGWFCFEVHIFDCRPAVLAYFHEAFTQLGGQGIGPGHGRVTLERTEQLDLDDVVAPAGSAPLKIDLAPKQAPERAPMDRVGVRFLSPTELKSGGTIAARPEFAILFARLGGFTGSAEYQGELAEFLPWLRAARWVGVGRQTVWGKGDVRVEVFSAGAGVS
jgi:hypothetical protein